MDKQYIDKAEAVHLIEIGGETLVKGLRPADVRPVVRGEWIGETVWAHEEHAMKECKCCHKVRIVDNFCPNCGADMRENIK